MRRIWVFAPLLCIPLFAQQIEVKQDMERVLTGGGFGSNSRPVEGAPYSATVVNESIQTLADGNRIVQKSSGTTARDSAGRTRNEAALPAIGNLTPSVKPHLVFIVDPVAQTSATLNLVEKTAHVMSAKTASVSLPALLPPPGPEGPGPVRTFIAAGAMLPDGPPPGGMGGGFAVSIEGRKLNLDHEQAQMKTEDLGNQEIEGVNATGTRTTRTIPAGEIGNEKPIEIVTEVWTSPDLKTIVMSKRTDPRSGEQIFRLTNIVRAEPDPALFTVPADFKTIQQPGGKDVFFYKTKE